MALPAVAYQAWQSRPKISVGSQATTALLAMGAGFGTFLGIRALVRNFKQDLQERQILSEGAPAAFANRLKMAFENDNYFGWGTDEKLVYRTLEEIPDWSTWIKVQKAYRDLYEGRNLATDLRDELDSAEFDIAWQIITSKS